MATQHLQGLVPRKTATADPKTPAELFNHVAENVRVNEDITALRTYNLKRQCTVAYQGYEAVLSRKKRVVVRPPATTNAPFRVTPSTLLPSSTSAYANSLQTAAARPVAVTKAPVTVAPAAAVSAPAATAAPTPAPVVAPPIIASRPTPPTLARRSDFAAGTHVMIRHTADLVACGARNLVGKMGRIVAVPQIYGQELYSVYIDDHEALFQVPFNALTLIPSQPSATTTATTTFAPKAALIPGVTAQAAQATAGATAGRSLEEIKMEHSFQLHRLMQQQYREIQVLQQQYAECRLVNPAALAGIQKELSKLRLVHLSQVQTLKSKQALDLLGK